MIFNTIGLEKIFVYGAAFGIIIFVLLIIGALALIAGIVYSIVSIIIKSKKAKRLAGSQQWFITLSDLSGYSQLVPF